MEAESAELGLAPQVLLRLVVLLARVLIISKALIALGKHLQGVMEVIPSYLFNGNRSLKFIFINILIPKSKNVIQLQIEGVVEVHFELDYPVVPGLVNQDFNQTILKGHGFNKKGL